MSDATSPVVIPLALSESEAKQLAAELSRMVREGAAVAVLGDVVRRIEAGGDEIVVQLGIEGGVIQGVSSSAPVRCIAIEWDEECDRLVRYPGGETQLLNVHEPYVQVEDFGDPDSDFSDTVYLADTAADIEKDQFAVWLDGAAGERGRFEVRDAVGDLGSVVRDYVAQHGLDGGGFVGGECFDGEGDEVGTLSANGTWIQGSRAAPAAPRP